jgi:hypothetical protein
MALGRLRPTIEPLHRRYWFLRFEDLPESGFEEGHQRADLFSLQFGGLLFYVYVQLRSRPTRRLNSGIVFINNPCRLHNPRNRLSDLLIKVDSFFIEEVTHL